MRNRKGILSLFFVIFMFILVSCGPATKRAVNPPLPDSTTFIYTGNSITYNVEKSTLYSVSNNVQTNAGTYDVVISLTDKNNYAWVTTSSSDDLVYKFIISPMAIAKPTVEEATYSYTGNEITFDIPSSSYYAVSNNKATDSGTYTATVSLKDKANLVWEDGTKDDLTFNFSIVNVDLSYATISNVNNEYVYTGEEIKPTPSVKFGNDTLVLNQDYTVTYQNNINVGQATLKITGINNFNGEKTVNYNIVKADPAVVAPTAKVLTYNASAQELINPGTTSGGSFEYKLEGGSYSASIPTATNAGTYKVYYKVVGNSNYKDSAEGSVDVTIAKANYDLSNIKFENKTVTYDGTEKEITITGNLPSGVTVTYTNNKLTNAGNVTATAKFSGDAANYNAISDMTATLTISKATYDMSAVKFENASYTYDGTEKEITITGELPQGVTVSYENNKLTNTGNVEAKAKFIGDDNHEAIANMTATLSINKADYDTSGIKFEDKTYTYDGTEKEITITGELPQGVTVSYVTNKLTDAGNVTATAKFTNENQNYNNIADMTAVLTINKAEASIETNPVGVNNLVYTGEELELVTAGTAVGGTLEYKVGEANYSASLPKATNAGTYTIYFRVKGDNNHNDSEASSIEVIIGKATYDMSAVKFNDLELTYNTKKQKIEITGELPEGVTVSYENNTLTNVGSTLATAKFSVDDNHNEISDMQATLTIVKADPVITAPTAKELTYTGEALELINEASTTGGEIQYSLDDTNYHTSIPTATNAGKYKVYYIVLEDANYNGVDSAYIEVEIKKADVIIVKAPQPVTGLVYTGKSQKLMTEGEVIGGELWYGDSFEYDDHWSYCSQPTGQIDASTLYVQFYVEGDENHKNYYSEKWTVTIAKATYDMSGVTFDNKTAKYNGSKIEITITGTLPTGVSVTYENNTLTNVGSTLATAKFSGDYNNYNEIADMKATLTITKADSSITKAPAAITNLVYNTEAQNLITEGETSSGTLMYKLEGGEYSTSIPRATNHGTYNVWYKVVGDENHEDLEEALIEGITIAKATPTITAPKAIENLVYTGEALDIATAGSTNGGEMVYSLDDMNFVSYIPKRTDAGTYKLYYLVCENANYLGVDSTFIEIEIAKATYDMSAVTFADKTETYTGQEITITITGTLPEGVIVSYTNNALTNVGSTLATAKFSGNANYEAIADKTATLTIIKAASTITVPIAKEDLIYTGEALDLVTAGSATGGELQYKLDNGEYSISIPKATNAGTYKVYYKVVGDENHTDIAEASIDVVIAKATYNMDNVSFVDKSVTYDGTEKSITITGTLPTGVTVSYTDNTLTNVGEVTATASFEGDTTNYEAIADMTAKLTITKATYDMSGVSFVDKSVTYDGTVQTIAIAGNLPDGVTVSYVYNSLAFEGATNAGTYSITAQFAHTNTNYNDIDSLTADLIINQLDISDDATISDIPNQMHTGSAITPSITITYNTKNLVLNTDYELEYQDNVDVGTATINISFIGNYKGSTTKTFVIYTDTITYTVTYDANGGTAVADTAYTNFDNVSAVLLPATSKAGYNFLGWTGISGDTVYTSIPAGTNSDLALVAAYEIITYTITYTLNGGEVETTNPTTYTVETVTFTLNNPTKDYYTFTGWTGTNVNTPNKTITITVGSTGNKEYTANWTPTNYNITYNLAGGSVTPANPTTYNVETATFTLNNPTRKGYDFAGWTGTDLTAPTTTVTINSGSHGALEFTATWSIITYDITYDYDLGTVTTPNPATYDVETTTFTLNVPERLGYTFTGWTGTDLTDKTMSVTIAKGSIGDRSYTATWEVTVYSITCDPMGGVANSNNRTEYTILTETFELFAPTYEGYTFEGWTGANGSTPQLSVSVVKGTTGDLVFNANWTKNTYTISYTLNGGSVTGTNKASYQVTDDEFTLINPTRPGYDFAGWTGTGLDSATIDVVVPHGSTGNRTYTATWTPVTYTITFDVNGGSPAVNSIEYTIETETFDLPTNVTKNGYTLQWLNMSTNQVTTQIAQGTYGNKMFFASWTPISYNINYTLNGGTPAPTKTTYTIEDLFTLYIPSKAGYDFAGWTGTGLTEATITVNIFPGNTGDRSYEATWSLHTYDITYDLDGGSLASANPATYTVLTDTFTLNNPTKAGYTFKGWTGSNGSTPTTVVTVTKGTTTGDKSYTANWELINYNITYSLVEGASTTNPTTFNVDTEEFTLSNPTKAGYTFVVWKIGDNVITTFNPSNYSDDVTITGTFIECPYVIVIPETPNPDSISNPYILEVYDATTDAKLNTSIVDGKLTLTNSYVGQSIRFETSSDVSNIVYKGLYSSATIDGEKTLLSSTNTYTVEIPNTNTKAFVTSCWYLVDITINQAITNDPDSNMPDTNYTRTGSLTNGSTLTYTATIPSGFIWDGWYNSSNQLMDNRSLSIEVTVSETAQTFTAKWYQRTALLAYDATNVGQSYITLSGDMKVGSAISLTATAVDNYSFIGWYNTNDLDTQLSNNPVYPVILSTSLQSFTAKYVPDNISINKYYMNSSNVATETTDTYGGTISSKVVGETTTTVNFASYTGFELTTVRLQSNQSTTYTITDNSVVLPNSNERVYYEAIWTPTTYTINYELNDGTNDSSNPVSYTILSDSITLKAPTKAESTFLGWTGTGLSDQTKTVTIENGSTGNRTYTANWGGTDVSVRFYTNNGESYFIEIIPSGSTISSTLEPIRDNYNFGGWYNNINLEGSPITTITTSTTSLYAYWEEETKPYYFTIEGTSITELNTSYSSPESITFPAYYGGNAITTINMNYNWGTSCTLPSTLPSIMFGYYQTTSSTVDYSNLTPTSLSNYYTYNNEYYYTTGSNETVWACSELEWNIISHENNTYTLISKNIVDACLYSDVESMLLSVKNVINLTSGKTINSINHPYENQIISTPNSLSNYAQQMMGATSKRYFIADSGTPFSYYQIKKNNGDSTKKYGIRPVITVTF